MDSVVTGAFIFDLAKLVLFIVCSFLAFNAYVRYAQKPQLQVLTGRRFTVLTLLTVLVVAVKVFEDVLSKESGPVDTTILWFLKHQVPVNFLGFFGAITWFGAAVFLVPATGIACAALLATQHRSQAILILTSMTCGWALTYAIKTLINRPRPELWSTAWYWGSSFPSGHTLSTAVFTTAVTLCAVHIWPLRRVAIFVLGILWVTLMGLSRLILGVHWPTDVLAAICLGVFIPLAISLIMDAYGTRRHDN